MDLHSAIRHISIKIFSTKYEEQILRVMYAKVITDYHFFLIFIAPRSSIYPCTYCVKFICTSIDKSRTLLSRFHPFYTLFAITFVPFILFSFKALSFFTKKLDKAFEKRYFIFEYCIACCNS